MNRSSARRSFVGASSAVVLAMSFLGACSSDDERTADAPPTSERGEVVAALVQDVILPANARVAADAATAKAAIGALCTAPDEASLMAARAAVAVGWGAWRATDSFDFGPAMQRRSTSVVSYEVDIAKIDATLAATPPTDPETVRNRTSSSLRGYGAAWHLLTPGVAVFAAEPARCGYLEAVIGVIADETATVNEGWTDGLDGAPPYRDTATGTGEGALTPTAVIDSMINMQLSQLESTSKLLAVEAELAPGSPSGLPVAEMFQLAAQIRGVKDSYAELEALLQPDVSDAIAAEIGVVEQLLAGDAADPSETPPDAATAKTVGAAVEELRVTIATEVVSALDVTISFSENDGDS